ncbi:MAG TPA: prepilin-type N-terminal cleavage/methylation domain-containing protein, partial [bacterium]|nr:prepilin-type N-terminal cleavage/methylation domain-containing protein [bacterium]
MVPSARGYALKIPAPPFASANRCGFTLIELLIAVAVLGILSAIAGANYLSAMERADSAACRQNLRTLHNALLAYRLDYNRFPPADGLADTQSRPDYTAYGCGPAANGFWSGVSFLLAERGYCPEAALYCPTLRREHGRPVAAYPSCTGSELSGGEVPQWRFLRYAYNSAAADAGGYAGGENDIEKEWDSGIWLVRCLHLNVEEFNPDRAVAFPVRIGPDAADPRRTWYGEFELTIHGAIRTRPVQARGH